MPNSRKPTEDFTQRSKSRRKKWQLAEQAVKKVTDVVKFLKTSVESRKNNNKSKSYKPKSEAIARTGWRNRPSVMPVLIKRPSIMGPIDVNIEHMVLPRDLISQPSYETLTSQLTTAEQLIGQNYMLGIAGIQSQWDPDIRELLNKLRKEPSYVSRSTNFTPEQLIKIINHIISWINSPEYSHPKIPRSEIPRSEIPRSEIPRSKILIVDFMNLYYFLKYDKNISDKWKIYNIIEFMLKNLMNSDGYNRIIICVQSNKIDDHGFVELLLRLYTFLKRRRDSVLVLPAINKGAMDDFYVVLCSELLELTEHDYGAGFFVNDNYKDFTRKLLFRISITERYDELIRITELNEFIQGYTQAQRLDTLNGIVYIPHSTPRAYSMPFDPRSGMSHSGWSHSGMSHSGRYHSGGRRTIKHKKKQKSKL
jgi:hypothetical protein